MDVTTPRSTRRPEGQSAPAYVPPPRLFRMNAGVRRCSLRRASKGCDHRLIGAPGVFESDFVPALLADQSRAPSMHGALASKGDRIR
jgi:hypothetical protein